MVMDQGDCVSLSILYCISTVLAVSYECPQPVEVDGCPFDMGVCTKELILLEWEVLKKLSTTKFVTATSSGLCSSVILSEVCLKETGVPCNELIKLGAIYVKSASDLRPKRILSDVQVSKGDLIRIHPYPRRYKTVGHINWRQAIVFESQDYVILHKPPGIPSHPTLDNYFENVFVRAKSEVKCEGELYLPHRLDTDTSGLLLMGKSKKFAGYFSSLLRLRQDVTKRYRAIVASTSSDTIHRILQRIEMENVDNTIADANQDCIRNGEFCSGRLLVTSYLEKSSRTPKKFLEIQTDESLLCQLLLSSNSKPLTLSVYEWKKWSANIIANPRYDQITIEYFRKGFNNWLDKNQVRPLSLGKNSIIIPHMKEFTENEKGKLITFWDVDIELLSGRTHQCRGQIQTLGSDLHIAGDNMYGGATTPLVPDGYMSSEFLALQAYHLSFKVTPDSDEIGPIPYSKRQSSTVSYELQNSWWQPLSDLLKENSSPKS